MKIGGETRTIVTAVIPIHLMVRQDGHTLVQLNLHLAVCSALSLMSTGHAEIFVFAWTHIDVAGANELITAASIEWKAKYP